MSAHLGGLIEELAGPWQTRCASVLRDRRDGDRRQQTGAALLFERRRPPRH